MKAARLGIGVAGALVALSIQPAAALASTTPATEAPTDERAATGAIAAPTAEATGGDAAANSSAATPPLDRRLRLGHRAAGRGHSLRGRHEAGRGDRIPHGGGR